jgi:hypothetical protein
VVERLHRSLKGEGMRYVAVVTALFAATACLGADEPPKAIRVIEGRPTTFPEKSIPEGVGGLVGVIESCHALSDGTVKYTDQDLRTARNGDHVRFIFAAPLGVTVLGKKLEVSEAVFAEGVLWLRSGKEVVRCSKYEFEKMKRFREWYRQTLPAD